MKTKTFTLKSYPSTKSEGQDFSKNTFIMKNFLLIFLSLALFTTACKDDNDESVRLNLDGANQTGPLLDVATWQAAAQFSAAETAEFSGLRLTEVEYYILDAPAGSDLFIYGPGVDNEPGVELYRASIGSSIRQGQWNTHRLSSSIPITGEELWISVGFVHDNPQQSIGCDAGPANTGGDWLFSSTDGEWRTYQDRTGESVNWNIRGVVEE